jgi:transcriptional regulator
MYIPPLHAETDLNTLFSFLEENSFGALVTVNPSGDPGVSHIPWVVHRDRGARGVLEGHIARANLEHGNADAVAEDRRALVIFTGPHAYISPSWYPSTSEHGKVVPTWNYVAVHVYGTFRFVTDPERLALHLAALVEQHEARRPKPWAIEQAPRDYIERQMRAIVGIELSIERIEGKWKMSQNRSAADVDGVIDGLRSSANPDDAVVAEVVALRRRS